MLIASSFMVNTDSRWSHMSGKGMIVCPRCLIDLFARFGAMETGGHVKGAGATSNTTTRRDKNVTTGGISAHDCFRTGCLMNPVIPFCCP
jgi:hypothetical protein